MILTLSAGWGLATAIGAALAYAVLALAARRLSEASTRVVLFLAWLLHALGSLLVFARLSHAYGLGNRIFHLRVMGVTTTLTVLLTACAYLLFNFWR